MMPTACRRQRCALIFYCDAAARPTSAIQADLTLRGGASAEHLQALMEVARKRRAEPIDLDERANLDITPCQSDPK